MSGLQDAPAMVRHNGTLHGLHVFFTPLGARAIFRASGPELACGVFDLSDLWGSAADRLISRLQAAREWRERFAILDDEFLRALTPRMRGAKWCGPGDGCSRSTARRRSKTWHAGWAEGPGGISASDFKPSSASGPKRPRAFQIERACRMIKDERPGLAEAAAACGYHDQAHMTREWNALAGSTPAAWIARELPIVQDYELAGSHDGSRRNSRCD